MIQKPFPFAKFKDSNLSLRNDKKCAEYDFELLTKVIFSFIFDQKQIIVLILKINISELFFRFWKCSALIFIRIFEERKLNVSLNVL